MVSQRRNKERVPRSEKVALKNSRCHKAVQQRQASSASHCNGIYEYLMRMLRKPTKSSSSEASENGVFAQQKAREPGLKSVSLSSKPAHSPLSTSCDVCQEHFANFEAYVSHLLGKSHLAASCLLTRLDCEICKVSVLPAYYERHLESERHQSLQQNANDVSLR
jgi:hypothetical protein